MSKIALVGSLASSIRKQFRFNISIANPGDSFTLPLVDVVGYTLSFKVYWGDGTNNVISSSSDENKTHTYTNSGTYLIRIIGQCPGFNFNNGGSKALITSVESWGDNIFGRLSFYGCSNLVSLPDEKLPASPITTFTESFRGCSKLEEIPAGLFDNCPNIIQFSLCFALCPAITAIPSGLFDNNTKVTGLLSTFNSSTGITSIPAGLFDNNTEVQSFQSTFVATAITSVPSGLFNNNTKAHSFNSCFHSCFSLETIPSGVFINNIAVSNFGSTFENCRKLQLRDDIFYNDGEQATRFLNKSVSFSKTFYRTAFTGTQGTAPDLWNCDFGTGTPTKTDCFAGAGNSLTSISNYGDIPVEWI